MQVELVEAWTADGVRLNGALQLPDESPGENARVNAALLLSGVGSNFYGSSLMAAISQALVDVGVAALRVNTRGHDTICTLKTKSGGLVHGAALEMVDECRYDVEAWTELLRGRGFTTTAVVGHSLGAVKALYSQSRQPQTNVSTVVAISPPRLNHSLFGSGDESDSFHSSFQTARELAKNGNPDSLFQATFPFPMPMCAATYLDKYGPESRYDILKFAHRLRVPVAFTFGEVELVQGGVAFSGLHHAVRDLPWEIRPSVEVITGANHFYSGCEAKLASHIIDLLLDR